MPQKDQRPEHCECCGVQIYPKDYQLILTFCSTACLNIWLEQKQNTN